VKKLDELFLKTLRMKCGIPLSSADAGTEFQALYDDEFLSYVIEESSLTHTGKPFMSSLEELPFIYLLARKEVYTILAGAFAKSYDIGSKDGNLKKEQPFKHYEKLIESVHKQYVSLVGKRAVRSTPVLLTGKSRYNFKNYINSPEPTIRLEILKNDEFAVSYRIIPLTSIAIMSVDVYMGTEPIYDIFESPPINPTSALVQSTPFTTNQFSISKEGTTPPKYLGLVVKNRYGRTFVLEEDIALSPTLSDYA
jgi:hypothetical protein